MPEPEIINEISSSNAITPDEVVSILLGSKSIKLSGFGGQPLDCPFWLPNIETYSPELAQEAVRKAGKTSRIFILAGIMFITACLGGLLFWLGSFYSVGASARDSAVILWSPKGVTREGVILMLGSAQVTVPLGAMLPNGEVLRSVNAAMQTYATDNNETAVKK